ncbi:MAG TPA: DUF1003 domain-containing protein [Gemmatimonas sp.]|uniref:DUF1003 domain-containing protein n=1 Tax=Gemmatimonas sp. TaxID=1962908 RepID=UPI002EDA1242
MPADALPPSEALLQSLRSAAFDGLSEDERRALGRLLLDLPLVRDTEHEFRTESTFGDRMADRIAAFGGSWPFIITFIVGMVAWTLLNTAVLGPRRDAFDPYPYVFLNLMLSMLAALQAPVILMSQNRQAERDRLVAGNDYEVNLKAELEIRLVQSRLETLQQEMTALRESLGPRS